MVASSPGSVVGHVEVEGQTYQITSSAEHRYHASRLEDGTPVGSFTMTSDEMWKLDSEAPELMHAIVQEAMSVGLLETPPTD